MGARHPVVTSLLVTLFVLDVATDIATGIELMLNDHNAWGLVVFGLVLLPVLVAILAELSKGCLYGDCCGESLTDWIPLIFYHLYTLIILIGSDCQAKWAREAHYLRAIEGFVQAGSQLVLQIIIVYKGIVIHSFRELLRHILEDGFEFAFFYDKPLGWYWGLIQLASIVFSFVSFVQTCVHFNEWPKRRHTIHRVAVIVPFFTATLLYRVVAVTLLLALAGHWSLLPLGALIAAQVVTLHSLGLDMPRSLVYGAISLLAPVGYSRCRDPEAQPYGLAYTNECYEVRRDDEGDRTPEQVEMLRERSKNFLAMHVILGGGILGISVAIVGLLINFTHVFEPLSAWIIFSQDQVNDYMFPVAGFSYVCAAILTTVFTICIGRCFQEEEYIYPV